VNYLKYKYVYYGLTIKEAQQSKLIYKFYKYNIKGINVTLKGLKKLILDNKIVNLVYQYVKLSIDIFEIKENIIFDKKYDMIGVKIPFSFKI